MNSKESHLSRNSKVLFITYIVAGIFLLIAVIRVGGDIAAPELSRHFGEALPYMLCQLTEAFRGCHILR